MGATIEERFDGTDESLACGAKLADAVSRDLFEEALATRQKGDEDAAAVVATAGTAHVAVGFETVDEFYGAVMFQGQPLG